MMNDQSGEKPVVLVTGSAGLIGTRLVDALLTSFTPVGFDLKPPERSLTGADWIECDMTEDDSVTRALAKVRERYGARLASVVHLAAYYDFAGEASPLYRQLTVDGTRRLLVGLRDFQVEQFVFSSSLLVMRSAATGETIDESSPTEATWDYPTSKLDAEGVIRRFRAGIPTVVLRIAGVYDEECHSIPIAQQISRIYEKKLESYFFPGNAEHGQAFVHLDDLVECILKVIDLRASLGDEELFLVAEPDVMSYEEIQDRLGELIHGKEWPTIRIPKAVAKAGAWAREKVAGEEETFIKPWMIDLADAHYPVAIDRARAKLGWEPMRRLRGTLDEMIVRLERDPKRWYETNGLRVPDELNDERAAGREYGEVR